MDSRAQKYTTTTASDGAPNGGSRKTKHGKHTLRILAVYKSFIFMFALLILLGFMLSMIIMGGIHERDCPGRSTIPIWLIVFGTVGLVLVLIKFCSALIARYIHPDSHHIPPIITLIGMLSTLIVFFQLIWLVIGSVWIYGNRDELQLESPNNPGYCDYTTYTFAFASITTVYCLIGLICIGGCVGIVIIGIIDDMTF